MWSEWTWTLVSRTLPKPFVVHDGPKTSQHKASLLKWFGSVVLQTGTRVTVEVLEMRATVAKD